MKSKTSTRRAQLERARKRIQLRAKIEVNRDRISAAQLQNKNLREQLRRI